MLYVLRTTVPVVRSCRNVVLVLSGWLACVEGVVVGLRSIARCVEGVVVGLRSIRSPVR